jgi:hypothetical protein
MTFRTTTAALLTLLLFAAASAQSAVSSTAYEMYSWKVKNHWYYSILPRGRQLTYEQITTNPSIRRDTDGLRTELKKLAKGTEVFWMSDAPEGASRSTAGPNLEIKHPSRNRIKHIKRICDQLGLRLRLT